MSRTAVISLDSRPYPVRQCFSLECRTAGYAKRWLEDVGWHGAIENGGVETRSNDLTEGFHRVKRSGSSG